MSTALPEGWVFICAAMLACWETVLWLVGASRAALFFPGWCNLPANGYIHTSGSTHNYQEQAVKHLKCTQAFNTFFPPSFFLMWKALLSSNESWTNSRSARYRIKRFSACSYLLSLLSIPWTLTCLHERGDKKCQQHPWRPIRLTRANYFTLSWPFKSFTQKAQSWKQREEMA